MKNRHYDFHLSLTAGRLLAVCLFFLGLFLGHVGFINASELMSSADVLESGKIMLSVYGTKSNSEGNLSVSGGQSFSLETPDGNTSTFSDSKADIELTEKMSAAVLALSFRPYDGFQYRVKAGQVRDMSVEYSSGSWVNKLSNVSGDGFLWGGGIRWNLQPATIVSAGVAIDLSYTQTLVNLDKFEANGDVSASNVRYQSDEVQGALEVSRRWKTIEPYGGIKLNWYRSQMEDTVTKSKVAGTKNRISPFVGFLWEAFPNEQFLVEGSFVDEQSISAGFNIKF